MGIFQPSERELGISRKSNRKSRGGGILKDTIILFYEERAAIIEFCGNIPKDEAEKLAREEAIKLFQITGELFDELLVRGEVE